MWLNSITFRHHSCLFAQKSRLIRNGAIPSVKRSRFQDQGLRRIFYPEKMPAEEFTLVEMCRVLDVSLCRKFVSEAKTVGLRLEEPYEGTDNLS